MKRRAIAALEDVLERSSKQKIPRSKEIAFVLAYLGNDVQERWPFESFWDTLQSEDMGRWQNLNASLNGIKRVVGWKEPT